CYPDQPMGWPIFGSEKTVSQFSRDDLKSYMGANYRAGGMMLIAAGWLEHAQVVYAAASLFQRLTVGDGPSTPPARFLSGEIRDEREFEQAHLAFAFPGVASTD